MHILIKLTNQSNTLMNTKFNDLTILKYDMEAKTKENRRWPQFFWSKEQKRKKKKEGKEERDKS